MLIAISDTPTNERGPRHTKPILAAIHKAITRRTPVSFLFARHAETTALYVRFPEQLRTLITGQFQAKYPDCQVEQLPDNTLASPQDFQSWTLQLHLRPDLFPTVRYQQFEDNSTQVELDDPVGGVLQTLTPGPTSIRSMIELTVRPAAPMRRFFARRAVENLTARHVLRTHRTVGRFYASAVTHPLWLVRSAAWTLGFLFAWRRIEHIQDDELTKSSSRVHDNEKELQAASNKLGQHLFETTLTITVQAPLGEADAARRKLQEIIAVLDKFTVPRLATFRSSCIRSRPARTARRQRGFLLSDEELATLWHLPTKGVRDANRQTSVWRRLEPPTELPLKERDRGACELGRVCFQDRREAFGIRPEDRLRHAFIVGKTGNGKSTVLLNAIHSDMNEGNGVAVIDPHGDLADSVLAAVPSHRTNDVIVIDPSDTDFPVSINPLDVERGLAHIACDGMVSTFDKVFGTGTHTPQLHDILWNTVLALMLAGDCTLLDILRMFADDDSYRGDVLSRVDDPVVLHWWESEFPLLKARQGTRDGDPFASLKNKLRQLLTTPVIRHMVCQPESRIDFREAMDLGKIIIVNLSKGKLGERTSSFLGSLIVSKLQLDAMSRADIAEENRRPFYLYVDEFHNFATSSFASILSEARKFKLGLCMATQYLDQIDDRETLHAVFGNVGSMLVFAVGPNDAEVLAEQLSGDVTAADLIALPKYHAYVRLMIDGVSRPAFSMQTIEPENPEDPKRGVVVREQSRRRYAQPIETVQQHVSAALATA